MPLIDRWRLVPDSDLKVRVWDGECIVFNTSSMDTHFLDAFLSDIFLLLKAPASTSELRERLTAAAGLAAEEVAPERLSAALESLAKAGLIENSSL